MDETSEVVVVEFKIDEKKRGFSVRKYDIYESPEILAAYILSFAYLFGFKKKKLLRPSIFTSLFILTFATTFFFEWNSFEKNSRIKLKFFFFV